MISALIEPIQLYHIGAKTFPMLQNWPKLKEKPYCMLPWFLD